MDFSFAKPFVGNTAAVKSKLHNQLHFLIVKYSLVSLLPRKVVEGQFDIYDYELNRTMVRQWDTRPFYLISSRHLCHVFSFSTISINYRGWHRVLYCCTCYCYGK